MQRLATPGRIGTLEVPRRSVFPPILMNYASDKGEVTQRLVAHYRRLAKGGFGLIMTECVFPQFKGGIATRGLALYDDRFVPGVSRLAAAVHEEGALLGAQLFFDGAGRIFASDETVSIGPSDLSPYGGPQMRPMTPEELETMAADFAHAAGRAVESGVDLVELHMGHAHLLGRFLSPYWNRRDDDFGRGLEGRLAFPLLVYNQVRSVVGEGVPVTARLCLSERIDGGIDLPTAIEIGKALKQAGIDAVHTSVGTGTTPKGLAGIFPTSFAAEAPFAPWAAEFRRETGLTTIFAGKVTKPQTAEDLLASDTADFVSIGRAGLADPDWPAKAVSERTVVPCIGCNQGCTDSLITRKEIVCLVNPRLGFDQDFDAVFPVPAGRKFAVIGGGIAGIVCALGLVQRGGEVKLYEKQPQLLGEYRYCERIPGKAQFGRFSDYLHEELARSSVTVCLGVDAESAREEIDQADQVFWAGGSVPKPWDPGAFAGPVLMGSACFEAPELSGAFRRVIVVGAGQVGCDAALWLAENGHSVVLVDAKEDPLTTFAARRHDYESSLARYGVTTRWSTEAKGGSSDHVELISGGRTSLEPMDVTVVAVGRVPRPRPSVAAGALAIGDAARIGSALEAVRQGYFHAAFHRGGNGQRRG